MDESATIAKTGPLLRQGPKLFIIDARNGVERRYLSDWLHSSLAEGGPEAKINSISLPISDDRKKPLLDGLIQKLNDDPDTLICPVRIAWRIPNFETDKSIKLRHLVFGDPRMPGPIRARSILFRNKRRAHCLVGQPATIADLRERFEQNQDIDRKSDAGEFAAYVFRQAGLVLDIAERGLRGSRYKVPRHVADGLLSSLKFRDELKLLAAEDGEDAGRLKAQAAKYMKELIARPSPLFIDLKARLDRFMLSQGYEEEIATNEQELSRLRRTMRDHPTLLLFTHKTYIDGATPTDIAYKNDLPMLHVFGGINLDFFGIGYLLRHSGTIFIRRSFENNKVYKLVLRLYVSYLLQKRFPMTWAFEGTRSRLGKLMPPRYGLLKYVMDAAHANDIEKVHIIPVVTSFDLIRDVEEYATEQSGRIKKPESLKWFVGYLRSLREPMGRVYVDFGESVVVDRAPEPGDRLGLSKIAFEVAVQANRSTPITLTSLMCLCLLGTAPRALTGQELRASIEHFSGWAAKRGIRLSDNVSNSGGEHVQKTLETLVDSGLFERYDQGSTTVYAIQPEKHAMASYYRNSIIHHFLDKAIVELSLSKASSKGGGQPDKVFWQETENLRDKFKFEFFYPSKEEYRANLEAELDRVDPDWQAKLEQGGPLLRSLLNRFQPLIGHSVFLPFVEAYTVVLDILARLEEGEAIDKKTCVELALNEGHQAYLLRRITSQASIGKILFENGFKLAANLGLTGESTRETVEKRKKVLKEFRELSRRMEKSRIEVLALADKIFG